MAAPTFSAIKLPRPDLNALFALQRANVAAVREAQDLVIGATEAVVRAQYAWVEQTFARANGKAPVTPEAVVAGFKDAVERGFAVARQGAKIGTGAQKRVADLLTARAAANVEAGKAAIAA